MAADRWIVLAVIGAGILAATGCAPSAARHDVPHDAPSGGQTLKQMRSALAGIPGLRVVEADGGGKPNIKGRTGYDVRFELEPGYTIADGAALVDFVVASVWSVREGYMPNTYVTVAMNAPVAEDFSIARSAEDAGWVKDPVIPPGQHTYTAVDVDLMEYTPEGVRNRERLGPWPGAVPRLPGGITAGKEG